MPIYEYRCENGHTFEVMQRMTEDPLAVCTTCEAPVQRVFHPVAVHFKGSGFYTTDYGSKRQDASQDKDKSAEKPKDKPAESKPASGSGSTSTDA
jgi:putative FmdB family regulatory protein